MLTVNGGTEQAPLAVEAKANVAGVPMGDRRRRAPAPRKRARYVRRSFEDEMAGVNHESGNGGIDRTPLARVKPVAVAMMPASVQVDTAKLWAVVQKGSQEENCRGPMSISIESVNFQYAAKAIETSGWGPIRLLRVFRRGEGHSTARCKIRARHAYAERHR